MQQIEIKSNGYLGRGYIVKSKMAMYGFLDSKNKPYRLILNGNDNDSEVDEDMLANFSFILNFNSNIDHLELMDLKIDLLPSLSAILNQVQVKNLTLTFNKAFNITHDNINHIKDFCTKHHSKIYWDRREVIKFCPIAKESFAAIGLKESEVDELINCAVECDRKNVQISLDGVKSHMHEDTVRIEIKSNNAQGYSVQNGPVIYGLPIDANTSYHLVLNGNDLDDIEDIRAGLGLLIKINPYIDDLEIYDLNLDVLNDLSDILGNIQIKTLTFSLDFTYKIYHKYIDCIKDFCAAHGARACWMGEYFVAACPKVHGFLQTMMNREICSQDDMISCEECEDGESEWGESYLESSESISNTSSKYSIEHLYKSSSEAESKNFFELSGSENYATWWIFSPIKSVNQFNCPVVGSDVVSATRFTDPEVNNNNHKECLKGAQTCGSVLDSQQNGSIVPQEQVVENPLLLKEVDVKLSLNSVTYEIGTNFPDSILGKRFGHGDINVPDDPSEHEGLDQLGVLKRQCIGMEYDEAPLDQE